MTEKEAILHCEERAKICDKCGEEHAKLAQWLRELLKYRAIGTVEECREAVEKQKPKKPDYEGDGYADGHIVYDTWICPCCEEHYEVDFDDYKYCPECGQAIDRGEEDVYDTRSDCGS